MTTIPPVTDQEGGEDRAWFDARPSQRFRARRDDDGFWLIRRRGDVFLRTFTRDPVPSTGTDAELGTAWFASAYPEMPSIKAQRKARQAGVRRAGGR